MKTPVEMRDLESLISLFPATLIVEYKVST